MRLWRLVAALGLSAVILGGPMQAAPVSAAQQCFAETGQCVQGRFLDYWQAHGGLARNGFPLTGERRETLEDGQEYTVQYFERVRLERHPENAAPYDVLLGQFGRQILAENALLSGTFAALYQGSPGGRERLGAPRGLATETVGAAQTFQRGLMIWRGDQRRIYVLSGTPVTSGVVLLAPTGQSSFVDTWTDGMPAGGGPVPTEPGAFVPQRGFFTVWREHEAVRSALGYAATPNEIGYTLRVQEFDGGTLITGDTPVGRFIYVIAVQRADGRGAPSVTYQAAWTERVGPPR